MMTVNVDNAVEVILDHINAVVADALESEPDNHNLAKYLILRDLWEQVTKMLGMDPDALREKADEMEEEAEDEDEEDAA